MTDLWDDLYIYLYIYIVEFYGKLVGKYTSPMDPMVFEIKTTSSSFGRAEKLKNHLMSKDFSKKDL